MIIVNMWHCIDLYVTIHNFLLLHVSLFSVVRRNFYCHYKTRALSSSISWILHEILQNVDAISNYSTRPERNLLNDRQSISCSGLTSVSSLIHHYWKFRDTSNAFVWTLCINRNLKKNGTYSSVKYNSTSGWTQSNRVMSYSESANRKFICVNRL